MKFIFIIVFISVGVLYASEYMFGLYQKEMLLFIALFFAVVLFIYILNLFKKLEELNRHLALRTKELNESKERLDLALQIGDMGSWDIDFLSGKLVVNDQWLKVVGCEADADNNVTHAIWLSTIHPDDRERVLKFGSDYKDGLIDEYNLEYRGITKESDTIWLLSKGAIVQRDKNNKPVRMVGIVSDITKDKLYKDSLKHAKIQAEEAVRMKSEFLANMSHEIRTPLNAIIGFIDLLKEQEKDDEKLNYLNIVSRSSRSLVDIINDILDFSKIESGKLTIEKADFNSYEEFDMTKELFKAKADEKKINLHMIYNELPKYLKSDALRIKQIINNLLSNAIKFTPENKNIYISIKYQEKKLFVSVRDEGIGIKKDKLEHIFEAFSQEDLSTARKYGGTGLGLTISTRLVDLLGGKLKIISEVGIGTEFYFEIPIEIGESVKEDNKETLNLDNLKGVNILIVEDIKTNQKLMKVLLEKVEALADIANDGVEAVEKFSKNKYDCILMDENMPNMNGIEATECIISYEKENKLKHTPIIALTANAIKGDRDRFLAVGMDEYLSKPIDKDKLYEMISEFVQKNKF